MQSSDSAKDNHLKLLRRERRAPLVLVSWDEDSHYLLQVFLFLLPTKRPRQHQSLCQNASRSLPHPYRRDIKTPRMSRMELIASIILFRHLLYPREEVEKKKQPALKGRTMASLLSRLQPVIRSQQHL
jgi:hypothetical protein